MLVYGLRIGSIVQWEAIPGSAVLYTFSRESLAIYVYKTIKGEQVCEELEKIKVPSGWLIGSRSITDLSSSPGRWTPGRTSTRSNWIILVPARRQTIRILNPSTAVSGMNA